MVQGLGREVGGEIFVDSSAALSVVGRKGNGKLRHVSVGQLWVQQMSEDEVLAYRKVHGKENPADICTKYVSQQVIDAALEKVEMSIRLGRAQEGLEINRMEGYTEDTSNAVRDANGVEDPQEDMERRIGRGGAIRYKSPRAEHDAFGSKALQDTQARAATRTLSTSPRRSEQGLSALHPPIRIP